jgi:hypothetical protein
MSNPVGWGVQGSGVGQDGKARRNEVHESGQSLLAAGSKQAHGKRSDS